MHHKPDWLKAKGYVHITPSLNIESNWRAYKRKIQTPNFVAKYAFFPLIHRILINRRYKNADSKKHSSTGRRHSHKTLHSNKVDKSEKQRPLHYASHFDSLIYGYYADVIENLYEKKLQQNSNLNDAVLAYRKIPIADNDFKGKSNIHFAKEAFDEVKRRASLDSKVSILAIDLKGFFPSLCHDLLYEVWSGLLGKKQMPLDHYNVFKSCTNFNYVLYNNLKNKGTGRNKRFDESKLAKIRKEKGFKSFFESNEDLRKAIRSGDLKVYTNPFRRKNDDGSKKMVGIPQGLPISAVLANLYLLDFDSTIVRELVEKKGISYRRYSDDILVMCKPSEADEVENYIIQLIKLFKVEISTDKTERFIFKEVVYNNAGDKRLTSIKISPTGEYSLNSPLTYLGFEYRGYNTLIKATNLAKYYRRIISIIKRRSRRAIRLSPNNPHIPRAVYLNQIKKLYNSPLNVSSKKEIDQVFRTRYSLVKNDRDEFEFLHKDVPSKNRSNYISYIKRCDRVFNTKTFSRQLKKKKQIIGRAINMHLVNK